MNICFCACDARIFASVGAGVCKVTDYGSVLSSILAYYYYIRSIEYVYYGQYANFRYANTEFTECDDVTM